jgi:hypothetical protein
MLNINVLDSEEDKQETKNKAKNLRIICDENERDRENVGIITEETIQDKLNLLKELCQACATTCNKDLLSGIDDIKVKLAILVKQLSNSTILDEEVFDVAEEEQVDIADDILLSKSNIVVNSNEYESINGVSFVRILVADFEPMIIDTQDTMGKYWFGNHGKQINDLYMHNKLYGTFLCFFWFFGLVLSMLSLNGVLDNNYLFFSFFMAPSFHILCLMNKEIFSAMPTI